MERKERLRRHRIASKKYDSKPENKLKKKIYKKKYDNENKERNSKYRKEYNARKETRERIKKWKADNKEKIRDYRKSGEYRERKKGYDKKYISNNREKINEAHRKYRKNNVEKVNKWYLKYNQSEKGKRNWTKQNHLRLSKKFGNKFTLTLKEIREIFNRDKICVYCGGNERLELDHIISLVKRGDSIFENFVIACRQCNSSKSDKDVFEWCNLKKIEVPKIVIELLRKQNQGV